jgi:hypothetical protein
MRSVKCVLQSPGMASGARALCYKVQTTVNYLTAFLTEGQFICIIPIDAAAAAFDSKAADQHSEVAADNSSSSSGSCGLGSLCGLRSGEDVLFFWLVTFGLLLPLYIMYLWELSFKQRFLRNLLCQQQQQQHQAPLGANFAPAADNSQQQQQQQQRVPGQQRAAGGPDNAFLDGVLSMGPLLHCAALCILLMIGAVLCELLLLVLPPPLCPVQQ